MCLGIVGGCWGDPVVALHLRNAADYRLPTFGPHGFKLGHSWYQWITKSDFLAGLTFLKKVTCLGRLIGWGVDSVVALNLRNAADYRLPTFGPHGTKLGHSWFQWIIKSDFLAGLTFLKKVRFPGRLIGWGVDLAFTLRLRNAADYRLPTFGPHGTKLGPSWYQWIIKSDLFGWLDNSKKGEVSGQIDWMGGWSRVYTPPEECCRLPPTYFLHGTKLGHSWYQWIIKIDFSGWFDNS